MMPNAPLTPEEVDALVRGYTNERLLENYRRAAEHPGTAEESWDKLLRAEVVRRGMQP